MKYASENVVNDNDLSAQDHSVMAVYWGDCWKTDMRNIKSTEMCSPVHDFRLSWMHWVRMWKLKHNDIVEKQTIDQVKTVVGYLGSCIRLLSHTKIITTILYQYDKHEGSFENQFIKKANNKR